MRTAFGRLGLGTLAKMRPMTVRRLALRCGIWLVMLPTLATAAEPRTLRLASDSWPPFTGGAEGQRVAVDLVQTALERAGIRAETTIVDWKNVEAGIRNGTFDGSAAMWRSDERAGELLFSKPYLENRLVLVGRKGSNVSATKMSDLAGKRVAVVSRYAYGDDIGNEVGVLFVGGQNDQDDMDKLLAGDVEYMLVDELVARYLVTNQPDETAAKLEIGTTPLARRALHFAIRKDVPGAEQIVRAFDSEIRTMLADGTYSKILNLGWIRADVDGDGLYELVPYGDSVGQVPPGKIYDVFGKEPETPVEKERIFIRGSVFEGWDAVPESYKMGAVPDSVKPRLGTTVFTLKF